MHLGIDLAEVDRIASAIDRWGERFLGRIFRPGEVNSRRRERAAFAQHVAGLFAAKEAAMKALGTGWRGLRFNEIVISREPGGKPLLSFEGRALERSRQLGVVQSEVSITHTASMAAAVVSLLCETGTPAS